MSDQAEEKTVRLGPPAPPTSTGAGGDQPYLVVLSGGPVRVIHALQPGKEILIGRGFEADLRLEDRSISRLHAKITSAATGNPTLEDLGSANGTFVNNTRIHKHELKDGDKIQVGPICILKFSYQDALERNFQQQLFERGIKDGLTGVYNKKYLMDRLTAEYAHTRRHHTPLTLLIVDVDNFKAVNDTHGRPAGDFVLRELAQRVNKMVRADDTFARYGGDEFVVLVRNVGDAGAMVLAQRIRRAVKRSGFTFKDKQIALTVSIGVAMMSDDVTKPDKLLEIADHYLYRAKKAGRNTIGGHAIKALLRSANTTTTRIRPAESS